MVKIKDGYVMSAKEKVEFDRVNALPRKSEGIVEYYYKPPTKYPARIYVFMHAEIWQNRNRRPMGLYNAFPFLKRPMNREEIEYHHFDTRLCYHQYEDWNRLLYAETREAEELDKEQPGIGSTFLEQLAGFKDKYAIGDASLLQKVVVNEPGPDPTTLLMQELIRSGGNYTATEIVEMMTQEEAAENRTVIKILLRELYKESAGERDDKQPLSTAFIEHKAKISNDRSRRNFARRIYAKNPLFALLEIQGRYPGYSEAQLAADLKHKSKPVKAAKTKTVRDLRRCQLEKLANCLRYETDEKAYHNICNRIVMLEGAHRLKLNIPLSVKLDNEAKAYFFNWQTLETDVKAFVATANTKGCTHQQLQEKYGKTIRGIGSV